MLDYRAAEDRGTAPMITDGSYNTPMPSNSNEEDFGLDIESPLPIRTGFTEMSMSFISYDHAETCRKLITPSLTPERPPLTLEQKETLVKDFAYRVENKYLVGCDLTNPLMSALYMVGRFFILRLWAHIQYPLERRSQYEKSHFPRGQALRTVTAVLEIADLVENQPATQNVVWQFRSWVPWYPLAIALVELCSETRGELADKAWKVIDKNYDSWSSRVTGASGGTTWRPVRRLHKKALAARQAALLQDQQRILAQQSGFVMPMQPLPYQQQQVEEGKIMQDSTNILPELPSLSLEPTAVAGSAYFSYAGPTSGEQPRRDMWLGPTTPYPWDFNFIPEMDMAMTGTEGPDDETWNDWNNFVYDVNAFDSDIA